MERGGAASGSLLLTSGYQLDALSKENAPHMNGEAIRGQNHTWLLDASYGVTRWLTAEAVLPFVYKTQTVRDGHDERRRWTAGVGDPMLLGKVTFVGYDELDPSALRIGTVAGVKLPLGEYDEPEAGRLLPASFQAGTGAVDLIAGIFCSVGPFAKATLYGSLVSRITTANALDYRFGSTLVGTGGLRVAHLYPVTLSGGVRAIGSMMDRDGGRIVDESGGLQIEGQLGAAVFVRDELFINVDGLGPLWQQLDGNQMQRSFSLLIGANLLL